jgi:hypothetical protein
MRKARFQIENRKNIFINSNSSFRKCHLQSKELDKLIFVSKNWPNDPRIGCKSPFNLADFIESDLNLEEKFEGAFERDEVVEL